MDLREKVIAVTGGGRGIGAAAAQELAQHGCRLALIDLEEDALNDVATACIDAGATDVATYKANVTNEDDVEAVFAEIAGRFDALHGLVNNAGITRDGFTLKFDDGELVSKMSLKQWQLVLDVNLTGVFLCGREAAAAMIERDCAGCIVNISSISRAGNMGQLNYSASKAGVQAMSVVWAKEFARYGVRSASIAPGFIGTDMVMAMKPRALKKMTAGIPAGRLGEPAEIASTVRFIFENDYVNGRCFEIDGGLRI